MNKFIEHLIIYKRVPTIRENENLATHKENIWCVRPHKRLCSRSCLGLEGHHDQARSQTQSILRHSLRIIISLHKKKARIIHFLFYLLLSLSNYERFASKIKYITKYMQNLEELKTWNSLLRYCHDWDAHKKKRMGRYAIKLNSGRVKMTQNPFV